MTRQIASGSGKRQISTVKPSIRTIAMTGESGGEVKNISDVTICVPSAKTYEIQEYHLPIYHYLCAEIEKEFF